MKIVLLKTLNEHKGLVQGAVRDWLRPTITEMTRQLKEQGITDWYAFDTGEEARLIRMQERAAARPDFLSPPDEPEAQAPTEAVGPASTAAAILGEQAGAHRATLADMPRAQRGPGRPPKNRDLESA